MTRWGRIAIPVERAKSVAWHLIGPDGRTGCGMDLEARMARTAGGGVIDVARPVVYHDGLMPPACDRVKGICPRCEPPKGPGEGAGGAG